MKIDQLKYFLETARFLHIGKASKALAISPSAISHSIKALEDELGLQLFIQNGKKLALTEDGTKFQNKVNKIVFEIDNIKTDILANDTLLEANYRVAACHFFSSHFLAPMWFEFLKNYPHVTTEVFTLRSADVVSKTLSSEIDLGFCFNPQQQKNLEVVILRRGNLIPIVRKNHPVLKQKNWLKSINSYKCVLPKSYVGIDVCEEHPVFSKFGIKAQTSMLFDSYEIAIEKVKSSQDWGFFPDWTLEYSKDLVGLNTPKEWQADYFFSAVYCKNKKLPKMLKTFLETLKPSQEILN